MTHREFTLVAAFALTMGALILIISRAGVVDEETKCATTCGATNLQPVYLPRTRACLCSTADGTLKVPQHVPVEQEG